MRLNAEAFCFAQEHYSAAIDAVIGHVCDKLILFSLICYSFIPFEIKVAYERVSLNGLRKGQVFIGIFFREQDFPI